MKITKLFAFCSFFLLLQTPDSKASHMAGGQITWECLPNGQFVFYMEIYRECTGTSFFFNNQSISYQGGSIIVKPDSTRWLSYGGNGNISAIGLNGCQRVCNNNNSGSELGATQIFPYVSDPVTLTGVPPPGGWLFTWTLCCRPSSAINLVTPANLSFTLRARMYPYLGQNASNCYDSSPAFKELPALLFCKGNEYFYNHNTFDKDLDSMVYSWAYPWHNPNVPVNFASGFSYDNPLPDQSFHPSNIPATLNTQSGEIHFATFSGQAGQQHASCVRVDSYRDGVMISSVFREIPFIPFDCPPNNPPVATINTFPTNMYVDTVSVGDFVNIPIQIVDNDSVPGTNLLQQVAVAPRGFLFSNDFKDSLNCQDSSFAPCATLSPSFIYDSIAGAFLLKNRGSVNAAFQWQTDCSHMDALSAKQNKYVGYNFIFKAFDEACDVPSIIYPYIRIVLERFQPSIQQSGNILSVDSADSYQWFFNGNPIPNSDTNRIFVISFGTYSVEVIRNGCTSLQAMHHFMSVSLDESSLEKGIKVYPNPFQDGFVVETKEFPLQDISLEILDVNGKKLQVSILVEKDRIFINNTSALPAGIYFIKLIGSGTEVYRKIMKL